MKRAVIFDMDGVIVDTEFLDFEIQQQFILAENHGRSKSGLDPKVLIGRSYDDLYLALQTFLLQDCPLPELKARFAKFNAARYAAVDYRQLFRADIIPLLELAKERGIALAVASSSEHRHILEVLQTCGIQSYFEVICSGEFFTASKPHPEIYLHTLKQLGVKAENAIAIEDSFYGIAAAKAAGITTIAYQEIRLPVDQEAADHLGLDMQHIKGLVTTLFQL